MDVRFGCTRRWVYVALAIPSLIHADHQKKLTIAACLGAGLPKPENSKGLGGRQTSHLHNKSYSGQALRLKLHKVRFFQFIVHFYA